MKIVLRARKVKYTDLSVLDKHNLRKDFSNDIAKNIDKDRSIEILSGTDNIAKDIRLRIAEVSKKKVRKDAVGAVEFIVSASPEFFFKDLNKEKYERLTVKNNKKELEQIWETLNEEKLKMFNQKVQEWANEQFGENVVSAVLHKDEKSPHIHITVVPIVNGRLSAKEFWRNKEVSRKWQTSIAKKVESLGLQRGEENSNAVHVSHHTYNEESYKAAEEKRKYKLVKIPDKQTNFLGIETKESKEKRHEAIKQNNKTLKSYYKNNVNKFTHYESNISTLTAENERLKRLNNTLSMEHEKMRKKLTEAELSDLRSISILTLAEQQLGEFKQEGQYYFRHKSETANIVINAADNTYYDNKTQKSGKGAISFLVDYCKFAFSEAVDYLFNFGNSKRIAKEVYTYNKKATVELAAKVIRKEHEQIPEPKDSNLYRVRAYLTQTRNINSDIVENMIKQGLLYADSYANAVFTNIEKTSAMLRGTLSNKRFVANRGKADVFTYSNSEEPCLYVFESPIDLMSYLTLNPDKKGTFVSINGNSNIAKVANKDYLKNYTAVYCCTDNDVEGTNFLNKLKQSHSNVIDCRPQQQHKDWNESLIEHEKNKLKQQEQVKRFSSRAKPSISSYRP